MENNLNSVMEKFYRKLYNTIERDKKVHNDSVFLTLVQTTKNKSRKLLRDSGIEPFSIPDSILKKLQSKGYIRQTDLANVYVLTARGVWEIEREKNVLNDDKIIKYFDKRKYDFFGKIKALNEREKVILFSMIAARTFSKNSVVDLTKDSCKKIWLDIVKESFNMLREIDILDKKKDKNILGNAKAEYPIVNLFRHSDQLPIKTKNIFTSKGNLKYYLNLYEDNSISRDNLAFLFWLIFEGKEPSLADMSKINHFLKNVSSDNSIYLFDLDDHEFSNVEYDNIIKDAIKCSFLLKRRWKNGNKK